MRRTLSNLVAMLCLLTFFLSSAACLIVPQNMPAVATSQQHTANSATHACCPQRGPAGEHTSSTCCTVHHQPVSAAVAAELDQPAAVSRVFHPVSMQAVASYDAIASPTIATVKLPPLIALRI